MLLVYAPRNALLRPANRPRAPATSRIVRRALIGKALEIVRTTRLRPRSRKPLPAERLHTDNRTGHVAVDVSIAGMHVVDHVLLDLVYAAVATHRQPVAGGIDSSMTRSRSRAR